MANYSELLRDPRWQKIRLLVFERDNWLCTKCKKGSLELHAHHTYYETGKSPWEYPPSSIITLCDDCHINEHNLPNKYKDDAWQRLANNFSLLRGLINKSNGK